jgi:NADH-quinone oxidoreductase subunit N
MTKTDFMCLAPFIILAAAPILIMIIVTISRSFKSVYLFSLAMFLLALSSLLLVAPNAPRNFYPLLIIDNYSILFIGIILFSSLIITVLSYEYLYKQGGEREEYFILLFLAVLGSALLTAANHFVTFFLGLETLSISLYVMIAYLKYRDQSIEAGVKFLVIASVSTAFMLFGMGLIYAHSGTMSFQKLAEIYKGSDGFSPILLVGTGLIFTGIGFKLALVPFQIWTPDVYQGAPAPVTAFIATVSKGSVLALAIRFFFDIKGYENKSLIIILSAIAILSMFTGNLLALQQKNFKRMLGYSSIAHMGYLTIILLTGTTEGIEAAVFYIAAYTLTSLAAFGIISVKSVCERDAEDVEDMKGLFWRNPWLATVLSLSMLSLAGIPITAGFISKFYIVLAGVSKGLWMLAVMLIINSVISLFYYLRVIKTMFEPTEGKQIARLSLMTHLVLLLIVAGILFLGIFPSFLTELIASLSSLN